MIKGFLDLMTIYLLTGFSSRPLHLIGVGGLVFFNVGGVGILSLSAWWVLSRLIESVDPVHLHEKALFLLLYRRTTTWGTIPPCWPVG